MTNTNTNTTTTTPTSGDESGGEIKKESKFYETLFLGAIAGFGVLIGFSQGLAGAKKSDEKAFNKGLMMINERPNLPQMESGARLATRALGLGSLWAFSGVGLVSGLVWWLSGAKDLKQFRQRMGEILPTITRNDPDQPPGRTEFESFRELFTYLAEESEAQKSKQKSKQKTEQSKLPGDQQEPQEE